MEDFHLRTDEIEFLFAEDEHPSITRVDDADQLRLEFCGRLGASQSGCDIGRRRDALVIGLMRLLGEPIGRGEGAEVADRSDIRPPIDPTLGVGDDHAAGREGQVGLGQPGRPSEGRRQGANFPFR